VSYFIITNNHKGQMEVQSAPGQGTCFTLRLPLTQPAAIAAETNQLPR
jgi:signal transduction histidine kinase